jgi:hypothetical protein
MGRILESLLLIAEPSAELAQQTSEGAGHR